jgi:hypothetical protein
MGRVAKRVASIRKVVAERVKKSRGLESQPLSDKNESATGIAAEDTDDDTDETDEEVEVTDDDGEEDFDGDAFSVLLGAGKVDYLGQGTAFKYQRSCQQTSRTQRRARQRQREMQRAANGCEPLTSYFNPMSGKSYTIEVVMVCIVLTDYSYFGMNSSRLHKK